MPPRAFAWAQCSDQALVIQCLLRLCLQTDTITGYRTWLNPGPRQFAFHTHKLPSIEHRQCTSHPSSTWALSRHGWTKQKVPQHAESWQYKALALPTTYMSCMTMRRQSYKLSDISYTKQIEPIMNTHNV